jgi:hypothetical protein
MAVDGARSRVRAVEVENERRARNRRIAVFVLEPL